MMTKKLYIFFTFIFIGNILLAQDIRYKEKVNESYTRFFYDDNYYLVDRDCEFKSIERVAVYDTVNWKFNGEFKDFNLQGKLLVHGYYKNGVRHGKFTTYHANGKVRWESTYVENKEDGLWKYYYPDGKPMLTLSFENDDFKFVDYWDTYGDRKIANGEGEYEMTFPIKGFTDHGFTLYTKKGRVAKGKPDGLWITSFIENEKKKTLAPLYRETFHEGKQTSFTQILDFNNSFINYEDFYIVPTDYFSRAESFIAHGCNFDSYSGFNTHIIRKFNSYLSEEEFGYTGTAFEFKVNYSVNNQGLVNSMKIIEEPDDLSRTDRNTISSLFKSVNYFIPSIASNEQIRDNITLTGNFVVSKGIAIIQHLKVEREIGE